VVVSATSSDDDYDPIDKHYNQYGDENATWGDVCYFMCNRTPIEWTKAILHLLLYFTLLYSLFMGIVLLGTSAQVMGGCATGELLEKTSNPITSVMAGVLATSLFQSSTATNFVLGALVGNGMSVQQGIYIAMGANVGNTVTNSVIALSHLRSATALERAISGATVNDLFLLLSILFFLPIEIFSNMLRKMTEAMVPDSLSEGYQWKGLIKAMVVPLTNKILVANEVSCSSTLEKCTNLQSSDLFS
jgi:sodium-dependent phosphate cotransporter